MKIEMDNDFRGNAYIIQNDEVLLNYSGGYADMANEIPNTIETRFASASMGKTFVAVGILQLIEARKLKFEDTLGSLLDIDLKSIIHFNFHNRSPLWFRIFLYSQYCTRQKYR